MEKRAVVLVSGGLDSAVALALALEAGFGAHALSFSYGQRHGVELDAARRVAARAGVTEHRIAELGPSALLGSALTGEIPVPKGRDEAEMAAGIPVTYVPARNTVFLSHALAWAEYLGAFDIFIGVNALDYSGYPDCRPEFVAAFEAMANLAVKAAVEGGGRVRIHAPLIEMTKAGIIKKGLSLGVDFSITHSCYDPDENGLACGACDSCVLRKKGFREAGVPDPTKYAPSVSGGEG